MVATKPVRELIEQLDIEHTRKVTNWAIDVLACLKKYHAEGRISDSQCVSFMVNHLEKLIRFNVDVMHMMGVNPEQEVTL